MYVEYLHCMKDQHYITIDILRFKKTNVDYLPGTVDQNHIRMVILRTLRS